MNKHYITIDIGTGSTKVGLFRNDGICLDLNSYKNKYYIDELYEDGTYFLPKELKETIVKGIEELFKKHPEIKVDAIISAGARQSIVLIDEQGDDYIGLPNIDNRGKEFLSEIKNSEDVYKRTGKWVTEDFPAAKILGFRMKYKDKYKVTKTFTSLSEWVGYIFTDHICIEPSQACETQLYDIHSHEFSEELLEKYGLNNLELPKLLNAGEPLGKLTNKWLDKYEQLSEAVFIVGGADTQIGLVGKEIPYKAYAIVSGTTSPIVAYSEEAIYDEDERIWVDSDLGGNNYLLEVNPGSTGLNYQRFKDSFLPNYTYEELEKEYKKIDKINVTSSLTSLRFTKKLSQKRGGFYTKAPFPDDLTSIDFAYSILGDIACAIYEELRILEEVLDCKKDEIYGVGFGFKSPTLCQMISDLTKKDLILPANFSQGTSHGLVYLCNNYFNLESSVDSDLIKYGSKKDSIIHLYYEEWMKNRN